MARFVLYQGMSGRCIQLAKLLRHTLPNVVPDWQCTVSVDGAERNTAAELVVYVPRASYSSDAKHYADGYLHGLLAGLETLLQPEDRPVV